MNYFDSDLTALVDALVEAPSETSPSGNNVGFYTDRLTILRPH